MEREIYQNALSRYDEVIKDLTLQLESLPKRKEDIEGQLSDAHQQVAKLNRLLKELEEKEAVQNERATTK